jgi:nitroimidazol reductase NimA-like FMN-containing flavoprotein (pyridoxamine 5'-phosphate oxidase superfamily)
MKTHQLTLEQITHLLQESETGTLATINHDGTPYIVPIHFILLNGCIYLHGLSVGQKLDNIRENPVICFNVYKMEGLLLDEKETPCDTNTQYQSVTMQGKARLIDSLEHKRKVLQAIVNKYVPKLSDKVLPDNMIKGTSVIEIMIENITGKYWK